MIWLAAYLFVGWLLAECCNWSEKRLSRGSGLKFGAWLWLILGWPLVAVSSIVTIIMRRSK